MFICVYLELLELAKNRYRAFLNITENDRPHFVLQIPQLYNFMAQIAVSEEPTAASEPPGVVVAEDELLLWGVRCRIAEAYQDINRM